MGASEYPSIRETITASIASDAALSGAVELYGTTLVGIIMPAAWATANLSFQASHDASDYHDMYSAAGAEYTVAASAGQYIVIDPNDFAGVGNLKIRSGVAATTVAQATSSITLVVKPV